MGGTLPPRFRYSVVRALRQVLGAAVAWEYLRRNPAKATGRNSAPEVVERVVLEPEEVEVIAGELRSPYDVAVIVGAWCYLRPGELLALELATWTGTSCMSEGRSTARGEPRRAARRAARSGPSHHPREPARRSPDFHRARYPPALSGSVRGAVRPSQLPSTGVGVVRARRRRDYPQAPTLGDRVGTCRRHPAIGRRAVRGNERHDARARLNAHLALDEHGRRKGMSRCVLGAFRP